MTAGPARTKVLWLVKGLGPGGAEMLLVSAARVSDRERVEYEVAYVLPWKDRLVPRLQELGVRTHCLGRSASDLRWPLRLRRLVTSGAFDVVHLHSPLVAGVARLVLLTVPRRRRPVVVSTEHNVWDSYALPTRLLNALLYGRDDRRWAVSEHVHRSVWWPFRRRVEVLVHGLVLDDIEQSRPRRAAVRASLGAGPEDVVVGTVANYRPQKGYPDLLRAAAEVLQRVPAARFVTVGQGPLEQEIVALHAELGLDDRFRLLGYRADVPDVLSACDVFALASHHEGFPIAVMEAMAMGLPLVATSVGGIADAVVDGQTGLLVPPGEPQQLAAALVRMTSDDGLRQRCAAATLGAGRVFDIRAAVATVERAYGELTRPTATRARRSAGLPSR